MSLGLLIILFSFFYGIFGSLGFLFLIKNIDRRIKMQRVKVLEARIIGLKLFLADHMYGIYNKEESIPKCKILKFKKKNVDQTN